MTDFLRCYCLYFQVEQGRIFVWCLRIVVVELLHDRVLIDAEKPATVRYCQDRILCTSCKTQQPIFSIQVTMMMASDIDVIVYDELPLPKHQRMSWRGHGALDVSRLCLHRVYQPTMPLPLIQRRLQTRRLL